MGEKTKRVMDEETRKKLEGLLPFSVKSTTEFTPSSIGEDIPEEYRPVFSIRPFNREEMRSATTIFKGLSNDSESGDLEKEDKLAECSRKVVMGWKNLFDVGTGEEIEYTQDVNGGADKEKFEMITPDMKASILVESVRISGLLNLSKVGLTS